MQTVTFEISEHFYAMLAKQGFDAEKASGTFLEQLMHAYADDIMMGEAALKAREEGYIGEEASADVLNDMLNAKD